MKKNFLRFLPLVFALLCALGTATVFHGCDIKEDGTWMRCHDARNLALWISLGLSALLLAAALLPGRVLSMILFGVSLAGCILLFLVPGTLRPLCMMKTMHCYTMMQPFVRIMASLTGLSSLLLLIRTMRKA